MSSSDVARAARALTTGAREKLIDFAIATDKSYKVGWHHEVIASKLQEAYQKVIRGERARIILEIPPRHGKSELASIKFPAWVLGKSPEFPVILTSYAQDLAVDFGSATRDLMNSASYQAIFKTRLKSDSKAKAKWNTEEGGGYVAAGVGGPITGKGFKIGIVDDSFKNREEADSETIRESRWKWYRSTFITREDGNGAIIVIATRWHDGDLIGKILASPTAGDWEVIKMPAIAEEDETYRKQGDALWPYRFPLEVLNKRKADMGPYEFSSQFQQNPVDEASREFKQHWFKSRSLEEVLKLSTRRFVTIDAAWALKDKSDFIGIAINYVDNENNWNLNAYHVKCNSMELIKLMFKINEDVQPEKFGIEEGAYERAIKPFLDDEMKKRGKFFEVMTLKHEGQAKPIRIRGLIPRYSSGSIYHLDKQCADLELEAARFPKGIHDDTLDAVAYQLQVAEAPVLSDVEDVLRIAQNRKENMSNELL